MLEVKKLFCYLSNFKINGEQAVPSPLSSGKQHVRASGKGGYDYLWPLLSVCFKGWGISILRRRFTRFGRQTLSFEAKEGL